MIADLEKDRYTASISRFNKAWSSINEHARTGACTCHIDAFGCIIILQGCAVGRKLDEECTKASNEAAAYQRVHENIERAKNAITSKQVKPDV